MTPIRRLAPRLRYGVHRANRFQDSVVREVTSLSGRTSMFDSYCWEACLLYAIRRNQGNRHGISCCEAEVLERESGYGMVVDLDHLSPEERNVAGYAVKAINSEGGAKGGPFKHPLWNELEHRTSFELIYLLTFEETPPAPRQYLGSCLPSDRRERLRTAKTVTVKG